MRIISAKIFLIIQLGMISLISMAAEDLNVLCIIVDDLRPELNCFGKTHIISPNIDQLASEGLCFNRAYCNIPVCGASRASLMTGLRPTRSRFWDFRSRADQDAPGVKVLPQLFKEHGYKTLSRGKVFHFSEDCQLAWDDVWDAPLKNSWRNYQLPKNVAKDQSTKTKFGPPFECADVADNAYVDGMLAEKAISDLEDLKFSGEKFFLAVGFQKPHLPFNAPKKYWDLYNRENIQLPEKNDASVGAPIQAYNGFYELRAYDGIPKQGPVDDDMAISLIHGYYAAVSYVDKQIGNVLDKLKDLELDQNTLVILFGDHGWSLNNHGNWCKHSNYDVALRTPLIIKLPNNQSNGKFTDSLVEFVDLYPTIAGLCNLPLPEHLEGKSMQPLLKDQTAYFKDFIIAKWKHAITIKTDRYAYTEWSKDGELIDARMLFDHTIDSGEYKNISEYRENQEILEQLQQTLHSNLGDSFHDHPDKWFK